MTVADSLSQTLSPTLNTNQPQTHKNGLGQQVSVTNTNTNTNSNTNNNSNSNSNVTNKCFRRRHVISSTILPAIGSNHNHNHNHHHNHNHNHSNSLNRTNSNTNPSSANTNTNSTGSNNINVNNLVNNRQTIDSKTNNSLNQSTTTTTTCVGATSSTSTSTSKPTIFNIRNSTGTTITPSINQNNIDSQTRDVSNVAHATHNTTSTTASAITTTNVNQQQQQQYRSFIDCLIRRFKDCFSENSLCSVPVFVVGNLSPGSDGQNLIVPPCVSLVGQNISRYASSRYANIRLINSLRESCRNIEELDLGTNKLTELVEIYKILQMTPNLRFLNLSENDLSRATPMALATAGTTISNHSNYNNLMSTTTISNGPIYTSTPTQSAINSSALTTGQQQQQQSQQHRQRLVGGTRATSSVGQSNTRAGAATTTLSTSRKQPVAPSSNVVMNKLNGPSGKPTTGVKERRAARAVALSRSVSSLSAKDAKGLASNARVQRQQQQQNKQHSVTRAIERVTTTLKASSPSSSSSSKPIPISQSKRSNDNFTHTDGDDVVMNSSSLNNHNHNHPNQHHVVPSTTTTNQSVYSRRTFESIRVLAMNNTHVSWRVVCSILTRMPNLEELHLSLNNYKCIDLEPQNFRHTQLRRLYLSGNPELSDWNELDKILVSFPSLEALSIADCNISNIPDNLDRVRQWRKLCNLNISGWPIKEWPIIERLNQLPSLVDLKCQNVQVLNDIDEPRHHLIARLPKLVRLNGSEIEEREHAEKAFLRFFIQNQHLERPTRFHELIQVHGEVHPILDVDLSPPNKARIKVVYYRNKGDDEILTPDHFLCLVDPVTDSVATNESTSSCDDWDDDHIEHNENHSVVPMTVDLRKTVKSFKIELSQIFGLNPARMILYYIDREMVGLMGPEVLRYNQKKLWNYNVQDGDQFIVDEK